MMRNMSFGLTTTQILAQTKDVTRRAGWLHLKEGEIVQPVKKAMGLLAGERIERIGPPVRALLRRREPTMDLPPGRTCGDCVHCRRCCSMFGHIPQDETCDWSPSRFHLDAGKLEYASWFPLQRATPAAQWRAAGEPDPHGKRYDCERAQLAMGDLTDDELANGVFMHGDGTHGRPRIEDVIAGRAHMPIAWLTAAKDRIRWLSRALERMKREAAAYKWAYEYLQTRMESLERHGWAHDCDGEIEARISEVRRA